MTMQAIPDLLRVKPGTPPSLAKIDPASTPGFDGDKAAAEDRLKELREELAEFQERLWAEAGQSLLVVLQALDAGGKDGQGAHRRLQPVALRGRPGRARQRAGPEVRVEATVRPDQRLRGDPGG